jgi:hypothetical protein
LDLLGTPTEVVRSEVLVGGTVLEHVVGGGQDRGGDGADRPFRPATAAQAMELGLEVAGLLPAGRPGALHQRGLQPGGALGRRRLEERRLPALSSFLGHRPAQDSRCPAVGKRSMSRPTSETMTWAASSPIPGIEVRSPTAARKGARGCSTSRSIRAIAASRASTCPRCRRSRKRWCRASPGRAVPP